MGIEALTKTSSGEIVHPQSREDWQTWVSASRTRNYLLKNTLIDWLEMYGDDRGLKRDTHLPSYDPRMDFTQFIWRQGISFEAAVVRHLSNLASVVTISRSPSQSRSLDKAIETFEAMKKGREVIYQGVLRHAETKTYGAPDFLVRSDLLTRLFPGSLDENQVHIAAPDLDGVPWHYVVLDSKFTTLHLLTNGEVGNGGSSPAYKSQLFIYNRALGDLQGYLPPNAFLLGRGWEQTIIAVKGRGSSCMDRLGPVSHDSRIGKLSISQWTDEATDWVRRMRTEGSYWDVFPRPSVPELWPNMSQPSDYPWHAVKAQFGAELRELTMLWQVGPEKRDEAHSAGLVRWDDPRCSATAVGIKGEKQSVILQALIDVNQSEDDRVVRPAHISTCRDEWGVIPPLEFFVDFETVSDLEDDFSKIPERGGQPLIFMIGCGHLENEDWVFKCFIADSLTEEAEAVAIDDWLQWMADVKDRKDLGDFNSRVMHWSQAETSVLETNYNSARERHPDKDWPTLGWFDFLSMVVKPEPVVVRGAFGFGLKSVANSMHSHGLIKTQWDDGPADGLGAMVGAWWCAKKAISSGTTLPEVPLMQEIAKYNEADCKVMMEIINYLRRHH